MRKIVFLLVAALTLSLAAPAFAAVEFGGRVGSQFKLEKNAADEWEVVGKTGIEVETSLKAEGGYPVKAVVELKPWELKGSFDGDGNPDLDFDAKPVDVDMQLGVSKAWIETEGAFWDGGPAVSTRIGDVHISWDNYVGHLGDRAGVTIDGIQVDPLSAKVFYAWDGANRPMGLAAKAGMYGIDVDGIVVRSAGETNLSVGAGMEVIPGMRLSGRLAMDGAQRLLYRVQADSDNLIDGVKVTAAYRSAAADFDPLYKRTHDDDGNELWDTLTGVSFGVETTQSGIDLKANYDDPKKETNVEAGTEIQGFRLSGSTKLVNSKVTETNLKVARNVMIGDVDVAGEYNAKIVPGNDIEHVFKASTRTDMIPFVQDLGLNGEVKLVGSNLSWKTSADYTAPNGIELGAAYDSEHGPSATAGVTVKF